MIRDAEFGPVRLRAFGSFAFRVIDAAKFLKEIAGTNSEFTVDEINEQLRNLAVSRGMDAVAESKIAVLDLAANYDEVSKVVFEKIRPEFQELGLDLTKFLIENISLPPEVEEALDKRSSMGIIGNLNAYTQFQAANAMEAAASNPNGGMMGAAMGAGMGFGMANQMGGMFQQQAPQQNMAPPPPPPATSYFVAVNGAQTGPFTLQQLQAMIPSGQFTRASLVWTQGMSGWLAAETRPDIASLFSSMPPPPPPVG
jgi:membrane protease subunit (stomatin/prohibitin family)